MSLVAPFIFWTAKRRWTAKVLGLTIPEAFLLRIDEVIE